MTLPAASASLASVQELDDPGAQHQGLDLVLVEHQRRQIETLAQGIADARFALDRHPARHQIAHVAVDRPLRDLELLREVAGAHQLLPAHQLDDLEQAIGAAHGFLAGEVQQLARWLLTPCCQETPATMRTSSNRPHAMHQEARDVDDSSENCMGGATRPRAPGLVLVASRRSRARSAPDLAPAGSRPAPARILERPHAARHRTQPRRRVRRGVKAVLAALDARARRALGGSDPGPIAALRLPAVAPSGLSRTCASSSGSPSTWRIATRSQSGEAGCWCARSRTPSRTSRRPA